MGRSQITEFFYKYVSYFGCNIIISFRKVLSMAGILLPFNFSAVVSRKLYLKSFNFNELFQPINDEKIFIFVIVPNISSL